MRSFLLHAATLIVASNIAIAQVGINTNSPDPTVGLHIKDDFESIRLDGSSPYISFYNGNDYRGYLFMTGDNMFLYNRKAGNLFLGTANSNRFVINSAGNVGIGTSVPELLLHVAESNLVSGDFNANTIAGFEKGTGNAYLSLLNHSNYENGILFGNETSGQQGGIIYNNASNREGFQFRTNGNVNRMTIDNLGDVGIGISTPARPLDIRSRSDNNDYGIRLFRASSNLDWEISVWAGNFNFFYEGGTNPVARITSNGTYQTSDRRLKKNIQHYDNVLARLGDLHISSYEYLADNLEHKKVIGLIAQDVEKLYPEIVRVDPGRDGIMYYSIDYSKTGVLALKAIQELHQELLIKTGNNQKLLTKIELLEKQNELLQQRLNALEVMISKSK